MSFIAYLATDRARALAAGRELPNHAHGAALFADISGFTPLTDVLARELGQRRGAEELAHYLNTVYAALITEIQRYAGIAVAFSGDAVTCWFDDQGPGPRAQGDAALRAVACAFALQQAMQQVAEIRTPGGQTITLALKVAIASGNVRRLLVGSPTYQRLDVLAGETMLRLAMTEHQAQAGDIVMDAESAALLGAVLTIGEWREAEPIGGRVAVITSLDQHAASSLAEPADGVASAPELSFEQARPLLLPAIAERLERGHGDMPTELRPVVALFLRFATLDYDADETAGVQLDAYLGWAQHVVARYGGALLDLSIGDKGSYLYAAFGALIAHENDAERALRAALTLQAPPPELAFASLPQIGIARGTMRTGAYGGSGRLTYGVLGDAVNVAARLMQAAPAGQIFVRDAVEMAGADVFAWQGLPPLRVKGKPRPIAVFRLLHAREQAAPEFFQGELVGRAAELERLVNAVQPLFAGQFAGVAVVSGEAGVGKSRLVFALRQQLESRSPVTWAYCPSDEILRGSLRPFATWLRAYSGQSAEHSEAENRARFDVGLDGLIAELREENGIHGDGQIGRSGEADTAHRADTSNGQPATGNGQRTTDNKNIAAELNRTRSFLGALLGLRAEGSLYEQLEPKLRGENTLLALTALIRAESMRQPLVLELEDAHWLDDDSQTLLMNLTRSLAGYPVAILCAARPDDQGRPFAPPLAENAPVCVVEVDTLSFDGTRTLAMQVLHSAVDDELAQLVFERTNGNPFFTEQLLLDLRERHVLTTKNTKDELAEALTITTFAPTFDQQRIAEIPDTLNSLLVARLDRLDAPVREVVQTASVLGREWALPILAAMRSGDSGLPPKVRVAEAGQIWSPLSERDYLFRHVLLRDAAYGMQLQAQRRELHERAAHAIEQEYAENLAPHYAALAYHTRQAEDRERERRYARLAGDAAQAAFANEAARAYYTRLSYLLNEPAEHADVHLQLGLVLARMGQWEAAETHYRQTLEYTVPQSTQTARAYTALGKLWSLRGDYSIATNWFEQAQIVYEALHDDTGLSMVLMEIGHVLCNQGEYGVAQQQLEKALKLARARNDKRHIALALNNLGMVAKHQSYFGAARELYQESLILMREIGFKQGVAATLNNLGSVSLAQHDNVVAQAFYHQSLTMLREIGDRLSAAVVLSNLGGGAYDRGDYVVAQSLSNQSLVLQRELGDKRGMALSLHNLGLAALGQGDISAAESLLEQGLQLRRDINDKQGIVLALYSLGFVALRQDCHAKAHALYRESLILKRELGDKTGIVEIFAGLASVAVAKNDEAHGVRLASAAQALTTALEYSLDHMDQHMFDETLASARAQLGEVAFTTAWTEGQIMRLEDAITLALAAEPNVASA